MRRSIGAALGLAIGFVLLAVTDAGADAAGPTDYQTVVVGEEPADSPLQWSILGGDSFVEVTVPAPVILEVVGYHGEPYLAFDGDGTVRRNRLAPTTYENEDRFAAVPDPPDGVSADALPDWEVVGDGGRFAWHDHRAHWMLAQPPPGTAPGDVIMGGTIPLRLDGAPATLAVESRWLHPVSLVPAAVGALIASLLAIAAWWADRTGNFRATFVPLVGVPVAAAAVVVALAEMLSMPPEARIPVLVVLLPAMAVVGLGVAGWLGPTSAVGWAAGALGTGWLGAWAYARRAALDAAVLPTDLWWPADRAVTAAALVTAISVGAWAVRHVLAGTPVGAGSLSATPSPTSRSGPRLGST